MARLGASDYHMLDVAGEAVDDVNTAQNQCPSGAVVVSPAVWDICNKTLCIARPAGKGCVRVRQNVKRVHLWQDRDMLNLSM